MVPNHTSQRPSPARAPLTQEFVDGFKRERVVLALAEFIHEHGLQPLTVAVITKQAKMARSTFYELFAGRDDAVAYATRLGNERLRAAIDQAAALEGDWESRMGAVVVALLETAEAEPHLAALCLVHGPGSAGASIPFDPDLVQSLAGVVRPIRSERKGRLPGPRTEELLAYAVIALIAGRLRRDEADSLHRLGPELTEFMVSPFR